jgi:hypothetical protein
MRATEPIRTVDLRFTKAFIIRQRGTKRLQYGAFWTRLHRHGLPIPNHPTLCPTPAMFNADQLRQLADILETAAEGFRAMANSAPAVKTSPLDGIDQTPLGACKLSTRCRKICARLGVTTVEQLAEKWEYEVRSVKQAGDGAIKELRAALKTFGKDLKA